MVEDQPTHCAPPVGLGAHPPPLPLKQRRWSPLYRPPRPPLRPHMFALPRPCSPAPGHGTVKSMYTTGRVRMAMAQEPDDDGSAIGPQGVFTMSQLMPDMWLIEMVVVRHAVTAGYDGHITWCYTSWLSAHAAHSGPAFPPSISRLHLPLRPRPPHSSPSL